MRHLFEIFGQTLKTLWAHKLRSFLTMFGIAWGVGSLLLLVGLGEGFRSGNKKQFDELGENVMFIWGGRAPAMSGSFTSMKLNRHAPTITEARRMTSQASNRRVSLRPCLCNAIRET